jgi:hypothetical protein
MRIRICAVLALSLFSFSPLMAAGPVEGVLSVRWGDPLPGSDEAVRYVAVLETESGERFELDPDSIRELSGHAAHQFHGQHVAVSLELAQAAPQTLHRVTGLSLMPAAGGRAPQIEGSTPWVFLLCKFSDIATEPKAVSYFQGMYGNAVDTLQTYWREVSYDKINLDGSIVSTWVTLPGTRASYIPDGEGANLDLLFDDCTAAADAQVNFAAPGLVGINMMFNDNLDCCAWGGGRWAMLDGVSRGWSTTWNPPWAYEATAGLGHEMGHGYGLPHANNYDLDGDPYDNPWDVMSSAWWNATDSATYGTLPKHINIYHRDKLGWIDAERRVDILADGVTTVTLDYAGLDPSSNIQMVTIHPGASAGNYWFTLETRMPSGTFDGELAGKAVIIHEVDITRSEDAWVIDAANPPAGVANTPGVMFTVGESWRPPSGWFEVEVLSEGAESFEVRITRISDRIFFDDLEQLSNP